MDSRMRPSQAPDTLVSRQHTAYGDFAANAQHPSVSLQGDKGKWVTERSLYIAWASYQRRQVSMAPFCGFDLVFLPIQRPVNRLRKGIAYLRNAWLTFSVLRNRRSDVIWMQLPQVPLMWVVLLYRRLARLKPIIVADCHNAMFRAPWSNVPFGIGLLSKCDIVVTHTDEMKQEAQSLGVPADRLVVIGDPPATVSEPVSPSAEINITRPWIVFPASFSDDEPIFEVIEAARLTPEISVLITGDHLQLDKKRLHQQASPNTHFLGFLSHGEFDRLIKTCDAVIAFTRLEGLQMSVCGEAIGCNKPMLISDTQALRRLFPMGTVFVNSSDPQAIATGMRALFANHAELANKAATMHRHLQNVWANDHAQHLYNRIKAVRGLPDHSDRA